MHVMVGTALSVLMAAQVMACAASITATAQTATTEDCWTFVDDGGTTPRRERVAGMIAMTSMT